MSAGRIETDTPHSSNAFVYALIGILAIAGIGLITKKRS